MSQPFCAMTLLSPTGCNFCCFWEHGCITCFHGNTTCQDEHVGTLGLFTEKTSCVSGMKILVQKHNTSYRYMLQLDTENMCCHIVMTSFEVGEKVVGVKRSTS